MFNSIPSFLTTIKKNHIFKKKLKDYYLDKKIDLKTKEVNYNDEEDTVPLISNNLIIICQNLSKTIDVPSIPNPPGPSQTPSSFCLTRSSNPILTPSSQSSSLGNSLLTPSHYNLTRSGSKGEVTGEVLTSPSPVVRFQNITTSPLSSLTQIIAAQSPQDSPGSRSKDEAIGLPSSYSHSPTPILPLPFLPRIAAPTRDIPQIGIAAPMK